MLREKEPLAGKRETRSYEIAEKLKKSIYSGHFAPGGTLRETQLASEYGSSRTVVREALRRLEAIGLVELHSRRKANVAPLDPARVRAIYKLRAEHEVLAVRMGMAEGKFTRQRIAEIKSCSNLYSELPLKRDANRSVAADLALHWALCSPCENEYLLSRIEIDHALAQHIIAYNAYYDRGILACPVDGHSQIIDFVVAGDAARAERAVRNHIDFEFEILSDLEFMIEEDEGVER